MSTEGGSFQRVDFYTFPRIFPFFERRSYCILLCSSQPRQFWKQGVSYEASRGKFFNGERVEELKTKGI